MPHQLKTLVVYDTNPIRSFEHGDLAYSFFSFGKQFEQFRVFIQDNKLTDNVSIAASELVIEELKIQKAKKYREDIERFKTLTKRLEGMPHIPAGSIVVPDPEFDCRDFIEREARAFVEEQKINLIQVKDENAVSMMRSMLSKVIQEGVVKPPFKTTGKEGKISDAGFKDNVIWESLMHYDPIADYDKVIFVTDDGGFDGCEPEFVDKWNKHFKIVSNTIEAEAELRKDYGNYIEFHKFYEYANKDYFKDYIKDLLTSASFIQLERGDVAIDNYRILEYCKKVEKTIDPDGDLESIIITTEGQIDVTIDGQKQQIALIVETKLSDGEYMEILESTIIPNII
jgi:hypothetical protein